MPRSLQVNEQRFLHCCAFRSAVGYLFFGVLLANGATTGAVPQQDARQSVRQVVITAIEAGFATGSRRVVRPDYWVPVIVGLRNRSDRFVSGTLQLIGSDRDGEMVIRQRSVGLRPGEQKRVSGLYWFARRTARFTEWVTLTVRLVDEQNRLLGHGSKRLHLLAESEQLVVDISSRPLAGVLQGLFPNLGTSAWRGDLRVAYLDPRLLPTWWYCLQAVDIILCAQPDALPFKRGDRRTETLAQWVRQGGLLILGPGSCETFRNSSLWRALPAEPVQMLPLQPGAFLKYGQRAEGLARLPNNIGFWQLKPNRGSSVLAQLVSGDESGPAVLRRRFQLGAIVQSAIDLKTLLGIERSGRRGDASQILPEMLGLRASRVDSVGMRGGVGYWYVASWPFGLSPDELLLGEASFRAAGAVLASLLMLFAVLYGLLATAGTWVVLQKRGLRHYSWLAFAGCAVAGSVVAASVVQSTRGVRADVKQRCIVDIDAASGMAHVRGLFGLKMPYDTKVDLELDLASGWINPEDLADHRFLRPAGNLTMDETGRFAVQRTYVSWIGEHRIREVPIRGTAKQFEAYWYGPARGTVSARFKFDETAGQLESGSWIANYTGLDLRACHLLLTRNESFTDRTRDTRILVLPIGDLAGGQRRSDLHSPFERRRRSTRVNLSLAKIGKEWLNNIVSVPGWDGHQVVRERGAWLDSTEARTAAMLTVFSDLPAPGRSGSAIIMPTFQPFTDLPRSGSRWLDLRNVLDGRSAILVGIADDPGPLRLKVNGLRVEPSSGKCIVRVVIPLQ